MKTAIEKRISILERKVGVTVPGSSLSQIMMDTNMLAEHGMKPLHNRESHIVWCAAIGILAMPKVFGYGHSILDALNNVEKKIDSGAKPGWTIKL